MSNRFILEIQNFYGGQNFKTGIQSFAFPQFAHIPATMVGSVEKMSETLSEITASRSIDHYSHLFISQQQRTFPKMTLTTVRSREEKFISYTFYEVRLSYYSISRTSDSNVSAEQISFTFSKFSTKEASQIVESTDYNRSKTRSADKAREQTMKVIKE